MARSRHYKSTPHRIGRHWHVALKGKYGRWYQSTCDESWEGLRAARPEIQVGAGWCSARGNTPSPRVPAQPDGSTNVRRTFQSRRSSREYRAFRESRCAYGERGWPYMKPQKPLTRRENFSPLFCEKPECPGVTRALSERPAHSSEGSGEPWFSS